MCKFDKSCGLPQNQIGAIKFAIRNRISRHLPILSEPVETMLFLQGRDAWLYSWKLRRQPSDETKGSISLDVVVKLKKEFHHCEECRQHRFLCRVQLGSDIYQPKVSLTHREPNNSIHTDGEKRRVTGTDI